VPFVEEQERRCRGRSPGANREIGGIDGMMATARRATLTPVQIWPIRPEQEWVTPCRASRSCPAGPGSAGVAQDVFEPVARSGCSGTRTSSCIVVRRQADERSGPISSTPPRFSVRAMGSRLLTEPPGPACPRSRAGHSSGAVALDLRILLHVGADDQLPASCPMAAHQATCRCARMAAVIQFLELSVAGS